MVSENTVYIGNKPLMSYVLAVVTQFNASDEVSVKARGRNIARAVDVAEIVRNRYLKETKVRTIEIGTEKLTGEEGRTANVSSIEIFLTKGSENS
ncbi:MAG TPA: DNA-binding protein Alba [Thermoplasmata archaeon]|nr:DNA-binding protein Alba [Thermoplasmata archaeon]